MYRRMDLRTDEQRGEIWGWMDGISQFLYIEHGLRNDLEPHNALV